jgi:hypothetical protein
MLRTTTRGRTEWLVSWGAFLGATAASVAANVAHARIPPPRAEPDWQPELGAQIAAAFWPLALLAAVEVLTRVPWPRGPFWVLARYAGAGTVALGAAFLSYRHMAALLSAWREDGWNAHIGPLVVDGLMVIAGTALLALSKRRTAHHQAVPTVHGSFANVPSAVPGIAGNVGSASASLPIPGQAMPAGQTAASGAAKLAGDGLPDADEVALVVAHDSHGTRDPLLAGLPQPERKRHAELVCLRALQMGKFLKPDMLAIRYGCSTTRWANLRKQAARQVHEKGRQLAAVGD